ncbi:hypothetical protein EWM64_g8305 [Hericium alpestre]|uniref:Uncharacterized protein n=1 Tax=Hericium alpestre TaxID=135208 RepID=A0A4Y9ZM59_9AGAM|nr:hypothetical protein EWM64_g8305 [Hericium alpestre]
MASEQEDNKVIIPSDDTFVKSVAGHIRSCAAGSSEPAHMYVETAGGVHSPTLSGTTQLDAYRPLFLPTILVGDSKLGGISSTIASYEALQLRGYIVDSILLFKDDYYRNWEYLTSYFAERGVSVSAFDPPPPRETENQKDVDATENYYQSLVPESQEGGLFGVLHTLDERHRQRIAELESMPQRTLDTVWWPFVQHGLVKDPQDVNVIDSATGDFFTVFTGHKVVREAIVEPALDLEQVLRRLEEVDVALGERLECLLWVCGGRGARKRRDDAASEGPGAEEGGDSLRAHGRQE